MIKWDFAHRRFVASFSDTKNRTGKFFTFNLAIST